MKRVILIFISLLICLSLSACDGHENDIKQDLADTLNAIGHGTLDEHSYIYGSNLNIATGDTNIQGGEITKKIANLVEYEILDISSEEDTAKVKIKITAPDTYKMIEDIAATMQEENTDMLLKTLSIKLDEEFPKKEFDVAVDLKLINEHWYLVPNGQLTNAFTGGLIEQYFMMGQNTINELLGEEN